MKKMVNVYPDYEIGQCWNCCPFFKIIDNKMTCTHSYFDNESSESRLIITKENSRHGNFPEKCPLLNQK
jgi:hypothetical protein